jgi:hypothetical protein
MALCKNFGMSLGLQVLDLSQNKLDEGCSKYVARVRCLCVCVRWVLVCACVSTFTDMLHIFFFPNGCRWLETWLEKSGEHSHLRKLMMSRCGMMDLTFIAKPLRQLNRLVELDISHNKYAFFSFSRFSPIFSVDSASGSPRAQHPHGTRPGWTMVLLN